MPIVRHRASRETYPQPKLHQQCAQRTQRKPEAASGSCVWPSFLASAVHAQHIVARGGLVQAKEVPMLFDGDVVVLAGATGRVGGATLRLLHAQGAQIVV